MQDSRHEDQDESVTSHRCRVCGVHAVTVAIAAAIAVTIDSTGAASDRFTIARIAIQLRQQLDATRSARRQLQPASRPSAMTVIALRSF